jgi:addiction module HigA family antidote
MVVIKSFADKRTGAIFAGYAVRDRRGRYNGGLVRSFLRSTRQSSLTICVSRPVTVWSRSAAIGRASTAFASMTNGESASSGAAATPGTSRSSIIIEEQTVTIKREDVDSQRVDFSDIRSGHRLPPVHPGAILRDEFLTPMGISVYELANAIKAPRSRVNDIVLGRRAISTDAALRLGRYFGTSPEFWINLQTRYDLDLADRTVRRRIEGEVKPRAA